MLASCLHLSFYTWSVLFHSHVTVIWIHALPHPHITSVCQTSLCPCAFISWYHFSTPLLLVSLRPACYGVAMVGKHRAIFEYLWCLPSHGALAALQYSCRGGALTVKGRVYVCAHIYVCATWPLLSSPLPVACSLPDLLYSDTSILKRSKWICPKFYSAFNPFVIEYSSFFPCSEASETIVTSTVSYMDAFYLTFFHSHV